LTHVSQIMDNVCENQNFQSADALQGIKPNSQDSLNSSIGEHSHGDDFRNKILEQNSHEENLKGTVDSSAVLGGESGDVINDNKQSVMGTDSIALNPTEVSPVEDKVNEPVDTMDEVQSAQGFSSQNDSGVEDQNIHNGQNSINESTNMDVEESNTRDEEEMNLDGKGKETEKLTEENAEENLSQDDEASMNPSETNPNLAEEDTSMTVSEGGDGEQSMEAGESEQVMEGDDQSMDQEMQDVENTGKDSGDTMDVSMANVDIQGEESMEVASPSAIDPICLLSSSGGLKGPTCEEQMEINETTEDNDKSEEMDETARNEDSQDSTKQTEELAESAKTAEREDESDKESNQVETGADVENSEETTEIVSEKEKETEKEETSKDIEDEQNEAKEDDSTNKKNASEEVEDSNMTEGSVETVDAATTRNDKDVSKDDDDKSSVSSKSSKGRDGLSLVPDTVLKEGTQEIRLDDNEPVSVENNEKETAEKETAEKATAEKETAEKEIAEKETAEKETTERPKHVRKLSSSSEKRSETPTTPEPEPRHQRPQRQAAKRAETQIKELAEEDSNSNEGFGDSASEEILEIEPTNQMCFQCCRSRLYIFQGFVASKSRYLCSEECVNMFRKQTSRSRSHHMMNDKAKRARGDRAFVRKCSQCDSLVAGDEKNLSWETMDFCNEECLGKYQTTLGSHCANCKGAVQPVSLGKYCVRFGYDIKQFCCSTCLEEFKKGLKVCSYCQKDISSGAEGFLAPVGDKGQHDFCTQACMEKYDQMSNNQPPPVVVHQCAVCNNEKVVKVEVLLDSKLHKLCSEPCFAAFKFVNKVNADQCDMCKKYFDKMQTELFSVYYDDAPHSFCCKTCMNVYILANRKIVPCNWCKVKKYNFDMIKRTTGNGQSLMMCSLNCLTLYQVSVNAVSSKRIKCDLCNNVAQAQYHLTMSDATIRNFCSYQCVMSFQGQYSKSTPITFLVQARNQLRYQLVQFWCRGCEDKLTYLPTCGPQRAIPRRSVPLTQNENQMSGKGPGSTSMPVISNVTSLATPNGQQVSNQNNARPAQIKINNNSIPAPQPTKTVYKQQVIVKPPAPKEMKNKSVLCKPYMHTKGVSCRPHPCTKETQT
ncbi:hypothetical protein L9F63_013593, partial [Diploptera punctata]